VSWTIAGDQWKTIDHLYLQFRFFETYNEMSKEDILIVFNLKNYKNEIMWKI